MRILISLAQVNIKVGEPEENFARAVLLITEAAHRGSQLILFPELWSSGYDLPNAQLLCDKTARLYPELSRLAHTKRIAIGGSILEERDKRIANTLVVFSPGEISPIKYEKVHLFKQMHEHKWLSPGDQPVTHDFFWGRTGFAICYDLRFPELFRKYLLDGVEIILLVAAWPLARIDHWKCLLRARAIENQFFIIATNCVGKSGEEVFGGNSAIISPWGKTIIEGSCQEEQLLTTEIDLDQVWQVRQALPVASDRRPEVY